jgi:hypothetical protein
MPQSYFEFVLFARPWALRVRGGKSSPKKKPKPFLAVAHSKFEAELIFKATHPRMMVVSCARGKRVDPPDQKR